ncbi:DUF2254 family protein [Sphingomonas sp. IW22]|uniref:DUF2254 family protein n=1 Tax=Sphingomonas sp. IW22 TaxID=3242489 RepID=UPI00352308C2
MNRSVGGSRQHLLWSNFWALPCTMIGATVIATCVLLAVDERGGGAWTAQFGWPFSMGASAAQELASGLVTVHAAFSTLYFSITLLVLTIAASNLGVRLIDRWISDRIIRVTLGLLLSLLSASLMLLMSVHADQPGATVPRLSLVVLTGATVVTLAWMSNALHHLGRMVHVDTSIAQLGRDAANGVVDKGVAGPLALPEHGYLPVIASKTGYLSSIDYDGIAAQAKRLGGHAGLFYGFGDFFLAGETIGWVHGTQSASWMADHLDCMAYRSDTSGPVFEANLLVEVAARALSPAVNDFYTALACCDRLVGMFAAALHANEAARWWPDKDGAARLKLPRRDVTAFMDTPLKALRQTAASYPSVSIRVIDLLGRLPSTPTGGEQLRLFLLTHVTAFAQQAAEHAALDMDRDDINAALSRAKARLCASVGS